VSLTAEQTARSIVLSYEGEDSEPHPGAGHRSCRGQYSATVPQAAKMLEWMQRRFSAELKVRIEAAGKRRSRTALGLRLWSKGIDNSAHYWSLLSYRLRYELADPKGSILLSGVAEGTCIGPAGDGARIDVETKANSIVPLCGLDVAESVFRFLREQDAESSKETSEDLTLWLRLHFDPWTGYPCEAEAPYFLDVNGYRYDLKRHLIGKIPDEGGTLFVMSDRKLPSESKGTLNE
jgi:hypothetical protein